MRNDQQIASSRRAGTEQRLGEFVLRAWSLSVLRRAGIDPVGQVASLLGPGAA